MERVWTSFPPAWAEAVVWGWSPINLEKRGPKGSKIIFETGKDVIPATVKEQRLFHLKWRNKNKSEEIEYVDAAFQWSIEPNLEKK